MKAKIQEVKSSFQLIHLLKQNLVAVFLATWALVNALVWTAIRIPRMLRMTIITLVMVTIFSETFGGLARPQLLGDTSLTADEIMSKDKAKSALNVFKSVPVEYLPHVFKAAKLHGVSPLLVASIIHVESRGNHKAVSSAGALGLMQVMPFNAKICNLSLDNLKKPVPNIYCGTKLISMFIKQYGVYNGIRAYNGGPKCAFKMKCKETEDYTPKIMDIAFKG